jgi:uncharacterized protein (DUF1810 family)
MPRIASACLSWALIVRRAICCSSSVAALFKYVHEQVVTVPANAAKFGSSCSAALSNS